MKNMRCVFVLLTVQLTTTDDNQLLVGMCSVNEKKQCIITLIVKHINLQTTNDSTERLKI